MKKHRIYGEIGTATPGRKRALEEKANIRLAIRLFFQ